MKKRPGRPSKDDAADADAFSREMADVVPLRRDPRGRVRARPPVAPRAVEAAQAGSGGDPDESHESFTAPGIDRREIRKLKRGEYPVADRRDLH